MSALFRQYTNELYEEFHYLATWLPTVPIRLGDVGLTGKHEYRRVTTLQECGIDFDVRTDVTPIDFNYSSEDAVAVHLRGAGRSNVPTGTVGNIGAGVTVKFNRKNAIFFMAHACTSASIENQDAVGQNVLELYEREKWQIDYFVVTELIDARAATIIISDADNASIDLSLKGAAKAGPIDLADVDLGFQVTSADQIHTQIIAQQGLVPLFRGRRIKKRLFRKSVFRNSPQSEPAGGKSDRPMGFSDLTPEDFL